MRFRFVLLSVLIVYTAVVRASSSTNGDYFIVTLKDGESISRANGNYGTQTVRRIAGKNIFLVQAGSESDKTLKKMKKDKGVVTVERNERISLTSAKLGNYTAYLLDNLGSYTAYLLDGATRKNFYGTQVLWSYVDQPALKLIQVDQARTTTTGAGALVAYIDTGVDTEHPALKPWLEPGVDLLRGESVSELNGLSNYTAYLLDQYTAFLLDHRFSLSLSGIETQAFPPFFGHGTLVAGVIHVVAPGARIAPIKAFDASGNTTMFTVIEAVYRAADLGADVLNMSFSTPDDSETFATAIAFARSTGMAIIASAGNDSRDVEGLYPAAYPGVYAVAATDFADRIAPFSNYGKSVSVTAPGAFVISTVPGGRYAATWGTSFSAPLVGGAVSLLVTGRQSQSSAALVVNTADPIDSLNPGFERRLGRGRLNISQALKMKN